MNLKERRKELQELIVKSQSELNKINRQIDEEKIKSLNLEQYLGKTIVLDQYEDKYRNITITYIKPESFNIRYRGIEFFGSIYSDGVYNYDSSILIYDHLLSNIKINDLDILDQLVKDVREGRICKDDIDS